MTGAVPAEGLRTSWPELLPAALATATVLTQITYPLVAGDAVHVVTVLTVLLFAGASVGHCALTRGARAAAVLLGTGVAFGFVAEAVGVRTGLPFGDYHYTGALGAELLDVPLVIPLAWTMMAWPALLVGRALGAPALLGGTALASWDLFLDPQMVDAGHWVWSGPGPRLNGIPVLNHLGWLVVAVALVTTLERLLPRDRRPHDDRVPLGLWLWTYFSSVLANLAFFGRPGVALAGGLGMGAVAAPFVRGLLSR